MELGCLGRPHGIRGEVKLHLYNPASRFFEKGRRVKLAAADGAERECTVEAVRGGAVPILRLSGIDTLEQAAAWRNAKVLARAADLPALPEGEYYHFQLLGLTAIDEAGRERGRVCGVESGPGHDNLKVEGEGHTEVWIPFARDFILEVDLRQKRIRLRFAPLDHAL